jgi:hypothetical protein
LLGVLSAHRDPGEQGVAVERLGRQQRQKPTRTKKEAKKHTVTWWRGSFPERKKPRPRK